MANASDLGDGGDKDVFPTYVQLDLRYPDRLSRLALFAKWIAAILPSVLLSFYGVMAAIVSFIAFWITLISGRYPLWMFRHVEGYLRSSFQQLAYFPLLLASDPKHVTYMVDRQERYSRLAVILRIPLSLIAEVFVGGATLALLLIALPAWWVILFTGKYPQAWFNLSRSLLQWVARVSTWQWGLRDESALFNAPRQTWAVIGVSSFVVAGLITFWATAAIRVEQRTLTYQADTATGSLTQDQFEDTKRIIYRRLELLGMGQAGVHREGDDRIKVQLRGSGIDQAKALIGQTARVEFKERTCSDDACTTFTDVDLGLSGADLRNAFATPGPVAVGWVVNMHFDDRGIQIFSELTRRIAGVNTKRVAVFMDGEELIAPIAHAWIRDGRILITASSRQPFSREEARTLAIQLQSEPLPVPLRLITEDSR